MSDDGERIRIPIEELDRPAYGVADATAEPPPTDRAAQAPEGVKRQDPVEEYHKLLKQLLGGDKVTAPERVYEEVAPNTFKDVTETPPSLDDLPPVRKFEEIDPSYEERRMAALAAAQAEPAPPVEEEVAAYLPVGGDAVDLKTAAKLGLIPAEGIAETEEVEDAEAREVLVEASKKTVTVAQELYEALLEVFNSIEAIPVEGSQLTLEEFNEAMDRQSRAREAVRKLIRG